MHSGGSAVPRTGPFLDALSEFIKSRINPHGLVLYNRVVKFDFIIFTANRSSRYGDGNNNNKTCSILLNIIF